MKGDNKTNSQIFNELMAEITDKDLHSVIRKIDLMCIGNNFTEAMELAKEFLPKKKAEIINEYAEHKLSFYICCGWDDEYINLLNSYRYSEDYLSSSMFSNSVDYLIERYKEDLSRFKKEKPDRAEEAIRGLTLLSKYKKIDLASII